VRALKATDGPDLQLGCGADLPATLTEAGLIDTYRLLVTPTVLGQGKAIFASVREPLQAAGELKSQRTTVIAARVAASSTSANPAP